MKTESLVLLTFLAAMDASGELVKAVEKRLPQPAKANANYARLRIEKAKQKRAMRAAKRLNCNKVRKLT